eukprot:s674_g2.t1
MGVPLRFASGNKFLFARIKHWIGDLDALKQSLDSKGSAGMKVCMKCKNVLKRESGVPKVDPYFVEVSSSNMEKFDPQTYSDIFLVYDNLLEQQKVLNKTKFGKLEMATGFVANCHGFLASKEARLYCPPSCWLLDVMHLYYSNGCASWEVVLLVEQIQRHGISLGLLQEVFQTTEWKRRHSSKNSPSFRKSLVHESMFSGESYRGSAEDLKALLPLLYFHVEETLGRAGHLKSELKSFTLLLQIHYELARLRKSMAMSTDLLKKLQVWSGRFWMGHFTGLSPKPHQIFSNDMEMIAALCKEAGYLSRAQAELCPVRTTRTYRDKEGVKRCVGKKKELRESQSPEYVFNSLVALPSFHDG